LERLGKRPGMTPTSFPLQSSLEQPMFRGFIFLYRLLARTLWEDPFIGVFRSRWSIIVEDGQHRRHNSQTELADAARPGPTPPVLVWASWPSLLTSWSLDASRNKILMPKKS
jgi:hypothetical protein